MKFTKLAAALATAMLCTSQAQAQTQQQQLPVDAEECQWSPPVVEARETGEHGHAQQRRQAREDHCTHSGRVTLPSASTDTVAYCPTAEIGRSP